MRHGIQCLSEEISWKKVETAK